MDVKYAWRVLHHDLPTSIVVTLGNAADAHVASLVRAAAEKNGVVLEPIEPDELLPVVSV